LQRVRLPFVKNGFGRGAASAGHERGIGQYCYRAAFKPRFCMFPCSSD